MNFGCVRVPVFMFQGLGLGSPSWMNFGCVRMPVFMLLGLRVRKPIMDEFWMCTCACVHVARIRVRNSSWMNFVCVPVHVFMLQGLGLGTRHG